MAEPKIPSSPQDDRPYTGNLIETLIGKVAKVQPPTNQSSEDTDKDDDIDLERRLNNFLTVNEVLYRVRMRAS